MTTFLRISDDPGATSAEIEKERQTVDIDSPTRREDGSYSQLGKTFQGMLYKFRPWATRDPSRPTCLLQKGVSKSPMSCLSLPPAVSMAPVPLPCSGVQRVNTPPKIDSGGLYKELCRAIEVNPGGQSPQGRIVVSY
jgi:hypothetical protein